jgi:hypothetical protein
MLGKTYRKILSAILASTIAFGLMVVILEEGPTEMAYYDGSFANPVTSPNVEALYYSQTPTVAAESEVVAQETVPEEAVSNENVAYQTQAEYLSSSSSYNSRAE